MEALTCGRPATATARAVALTEADIRQMAAAIAPLTVHGESMDAANMALCEPTCALNQGQRRQIDFIPGCPPLARNRTEWGRSVDVR